MTIDQIHELGENSPMKMKFPLTKCKGRSKQIRDGYKNQFSIEEFPENDTHENARKYARLNFSSTNADWLGGCGKTYKNVLHSDVKQLKRMLEKLNTYKLRNDKRMTL